MLHRPWPNSKPFSRANSTKPEARSSWRKGTREKCALRNKKMSEHVNVKYVAHLARLALTSEEQQKIGDQLDNVLHYVEKLKEVDVSGVEPTAHAFPLVNVTRADEVQPSLSNDEALLNAPAKANGLFIV